MTQRLVEDELNDGERKKAAREVTITFWYLNTDSTQIIAILHTSDMAARSYGIVAMIVTNAIVQSAYPYQVFPNHRYYEIPPKQEKMQDYNNKYKDHSFQTDIFDLGEPKITIDERLEKHKKTMQIGNRPDSLNETRLNIFRHKSDTKQDKHLITEKLFDNFVTKKTGLLPEKRYEVTTENTEAENLSAVGVVKDVTIALDDDEENEDEEEEEEEEDTLEPQAYFDSYGRLHQRQDRPRYEHPDGSYSYGVVHKQPNFHRPSWRPTGAVRIKVFHGPTRTAGHHRYAQWGYYIVQPSEQSNNHHNY